VSFKFLRIAFLVLCAFSINAQTFDIEQSAQLIRPRIKLDSKYTFDPIKHTGGTTYQSFENSAGFTFPITQKFKTEINLDLRDFKWKDIFKKNIRIKADQLLGTFKITQRELTMTYLPSNVYDSSAASHVDTSIRKQLYYANAGIIGLHLTNKYRVLFYSANISVNEEKATFDVFRPRFSGIIGQYHIRGLRKCYYYGFSLIYSDGLILPTPFFGGTIPLNEQFSFNYILPVQLNIQYHRNNTFVIGGIKADGYRAGIVGRTNMNYTNGSAFVNFRYRFNRLFQLQVEGGYYFYQHASYGEGASKPYFRLSSPYHTSLHPSFYGNVSLNIYFGKSLLEKVTDQLF
jgi:hypothetical protein